MNRRDAEFEAASRKKKLKSRNLKRVLNLVTDAMRFTPTPTNQPPI